MSCMPQSRNGQAVLGLRDRALMDGRMNRQHAERQHARTHQRMNGFTLVEVLIVTVILFAVGGGLLSTFLTGQSSFLSGEASVQVQQEARRAFDAMVRELREAHVRTTPITTLSGGPKQFNFQVALGYTDGVVDWGGDGQKNHWLHYAIKNFGNGPQLIRYRDQAETGGAVPNTCTAATNCRVLANNVRLEVGTSTAPLGNTRAADTFVYDRDNDVVTINLQCERVDSKLPGGRQATPVLSARVKLRNPNTDD